MALVATVVVWVVLDRVRPTLLMTIVSEVIHVRWKSETNENQRNEEIIIKEVFDGQRQTLLINRNGHSLLRLTYVASRI